MDSLHVIVMRAMVASLLSLSAQNATAGNDQPASRLAIVGKNNASETDSSKFKRSKPEDFTFRLGDSLPIIATGELAKKITAELGKTASSEALTLYLNGVKMSNLTSSSLQDESGNALRLSFDLSRNANDDQNRTVWDTLFKKSPDIVMTIDPALAIGNDLPVVVRHEQPLKLYVATPTAVWLVLGGGLVILFGGFALLVRRTDMLRDAGPGTRYSLGKSQMAFWGLIVMLSFVGVWILTGAMERVPPQALILLGISGATGLTAILIGNGKKSELGSKLTGLRQEKQRLEAQHPSSDEIQVRLSAIDQEIADLNRQLQASESNGYWRDICNDGNGVSFHRLQVVVWTLVLGAVFVRSVAEVLSMPEFPETLLTLLGISNATYLGFKIPEKS